MTPSRVGLFGGTFDPPHVGHLVVALNVRHAVGLDEVLLVVAGDPWQKAEARAVSPPEERLAMVEAAVADVPGLRASRLEIDRPGPSYTVDTLHTLEEADRAAGRSVEYLVVLGRDAAEGVETWERADQLRGRYRFIVVDRPGVEGGPLPGGYDWTRVECPRLDVSSTDLRARARDGRPLRFLLPEPVLRTVRDRGLYGAERG